MTTLKILILLCVAVVAGAASTNDQLNIRSGCTVEAIRFLTGIRAAGTRAELLITELNADGDHAFVAYEKEGAVWTHCSMLGDRRLSGVKTHDLSDAKKLINAYSASFRRTAALVSAGHARWDIPDARPGDTSQSQVARAAVALHAARIQSAVARFTGTKGETEDALVFVLNQKPAIYHPTVGTVLVGPQLGAAELKEFAREHLGITSIRIGWIKPSDLP